MAPDSEHLRVDHAEEGLDLRGGRSVWTIEPRYPPLHRSATPPKNTQIAIVGAGITGAFLAERLARDGRQVTVFDRRTPASGSTAASTALLQWETDASMLELSERLGFEDAAAIYRRCFSAVGNLKKFIAQSSMPVGLRDRETLYLSGNVLDGAQLESEFAMRRRAGLPSQFVGERDLSARGIMGGAAIQSTGSAEVNPVALTDFLLASAVAHGATIVFPTSVLQYDFARRRALLQLEDGHRVKADEVILATGYEMPPFVPASRHQIVSTWAVATPKQRNDALWAGRPLIWEASSPYAYLRTTESGRVVVGGEDEKVTDPDVRDSLIPEKRERLLLKLKALAPRLNAEAEVAWSGFFGETDDGLPLIGAVPGIPHCYAAFGYGGNGITFSAIASTMIARLLRGDHDDMAHSFAIER